MPFSSILCSSARSLSERLYHKLTLTIFLKNFSTLSDDYFDIDKDIFDKDLGVGRLKLIPIGGAWVLEIFRTGLNPFFRGGIRQFFIYAKLILGKIKGMKPFYLVHTYFRYRLLFTQEEMHKSYLRIAELLELNPEIKGVLRCSWFLDPELQKHSPRLAYLRQVPVENGAVLFRIGSSEFDVVSATMASPTRKKLYEEEKYKPTCYGYIWPRKEILKWAAGERNGN